MERRFPERTLNILHAVGEFGSRIGYPVYAVGGFVRDLLLGRENLDIDLVVEGDGISFARGLAGELGATCKAFDHFGTAAIYLRDGSKIDVATARRESYRRPAALPDVEMSSIRYDLHRRDFTINSLAINLSPDHFGDLVDFFRAEEDLRKGVIRVLHRDSLVDDPTRAFRAIRFAHRYRFRISPMTRRLIRESIDGRFFDRLSGKRLFAELKLLLKEERPMEALILLAQSGLLQVFHPRLNMGAKERRLFRRVKRTLDWFKNISPSEPAYPWLTYLLALFDPLGDEELKGVRERLDIGGKREREALDKREMARSNLETLASLRRPRRSEIYKCLKGLPSELLIYLLARSRGRTLWRRISLYITTLRHVKLSVGGKEIMGLGLEPGPRYSAILDQLLLAKLDGMVKGREGEIDFIRGRVGGRVD